MKYVILQAKIAGVDRVYPIIFPEALVHSEMAKQMQHMIGMEFGRVPSVRSAGFCHPSGGRFDGHSGSESLNIKGNSARSDDDLRILNMPDAMQGILL